MEDSIELLPAYFVLAEANICHGGSRLKKAEEFLIAAYWNLLKFTSEENEKGGNGSDDTLVSKKEIEQRHEQDAQRIEDKLMNTLKHRLFEIRAQHACMLHPPEIQLHHVVV